MKKKRLYQLSFGIILFFITNPAEAQISGEYQPSNGNTGEVSQTINRTSNNFPASAPPTTANPFGSNSSNNNFPTFPSNGTNNGNKWTFQQGTSTFFNSTNTFGNNSTTFYTNGSNPFGNGNNDCGFSVYAEGVGGKDSTQSSLPSEINLNESGFSVRGGVKWNEQKCIKPEHVLEIERMKVNASNRDTCTQGMITMEMNGKTVPQYIQDWCNSMRDRNEQ